MKISIEVAFLKPCLVFSLWHMEYVVMSLSIIPFLDPNIQYCTFGNFKNQKLQSNCIHVDLNCLFELLGGAIEFPSGWFNSPFKGQRKYLQNFKLGIGTINMLICMVFFLSLITM